MLKKHTSNTSWEKVHRWYDQSVGQEGHYYHQKIIFPRLLKYWNLDSYPQASLLDLACGQGVLARQLPSDIPYLGVDLSPSLIKAAKIHDQNSLHQFRVGDITKHLKLPEKNFSHAAIILALQNLEHPDGALRTAAAHLKEEGQLAIILNHPCFRIPRQSAWQVDESKKLQYRRVDTYMSSLQIPIQAHPGSKESSSQTLSYHWPLSKVTSWLKETGFRITSIDEWCSDKESQGAKAKMENRARLEFPLFMAIFAEKVKS